MLDELKKLNYKGGKEGLLFFLCDVIGTDHIKISDAEILCSHAPGKGYLCIESLIGYCATFGWIEISKDIVSVSPAISMFLNDKVKLNEMLIVSTVRLLFDESLMDSTMFCYNPVQFSYSFKNELLPLSFSSVRNVLISQGFLIPQRDIHGTHFLISSEYDAFIAKYCKEQHKQLSLIQLKKQLELNNLAGEKAELFAFEYEKRRLGLPLSAMVKRISEIDVHAGYDIVSFDSPQSQEPDRFIEVKAVSETGFYWSKNEYEISRLYGKKYFLYLVNLSKVANKDYDPIIISDPSQTVMNSPDWLIEPESYHIQKV